MTIVPNQSECRGAGKKRVLSGAPLLRVEMTSVPPIPIRGEVLLLVETYIFRKAAQGENCHREEDTHCSADARRSGGERPGVDGRRKVHRPQCLPVVRRSGDRARPASETVCRHAPERRGAYDPGLREAVFTASSAAPSATQTHRSTPIPAWRRLLSTSVSFSRSRCRSTRWHNTSGRWESSSIVGLSGIMPPATSARFRQPNSSASFYRSPS